MKLVVHNTKKLKGEILVPSSKSHTIRSVVFASLAKGTSKIRNPLMSDDTKAAINACTALGAKIDISNDKLWVIEGFGTTPKRPYGVLDMLNSGTSLRLITGVIGALCDFEVELDGDSSLRTRPMGTLLNAMNQLGARCSSLDNRGFCPIKIRGKMKGGYAEVSGLSSQYASSLLVSCALLSKDSEFRVIDPHEVPYIQLTMKWLDEIGIKYEASRDFTKFRVFGNQKYKPFEKTIPSDWSSAAFPLVAAAITESDVLVKGPDINDTQGDKAIIDYLKRMGADISVGKDGIRIRGKALKGCEIDLNPTPDALPALSTLGCFADGETRLVNAAQARIKETDRIKVMTEELTKMNANVMELKDGIVIRKSRLKGVKVDSRMDHRIAMALSLAGLISEGVTEVDGAESVSVTYPGFVESMKKLGAKMEVV